MIRVLALPGDKEGCARYRIHEPAAAVNQAGCGITVRTETDLYGIMTGQPGSRVCHSLRPVDADVVIYQRPLAEDLVATIPQVKAQGAAVVVELDDDLERVRPDHAGYHAVHPRGDPGHNWRWLAKACQLADVLTVSTPALARYAPGKAVVIGNCVPAWLCDLPHPEPRDPPAVGWSGAVATHPGDLEQVGPAVARIIGGQPFHVVGPADGVAEALRVQSVTATGWLPYEDYCDRLRYLDVGIVPLADHSFNLAKSNLKGLELAAVGVPFVATPTDEYRALHNAGVGLLASRPREWRRALTTLTGDAALRGDLSAAYRQTVRDRFTFDQGWPRWAEAWMLAAQHPNRVRRAVVNSAV